MDQSCYSFTANPKPLMTPPRLLRTFFQLRTIAPRLFLLLAGASLLGSLCGCSSTKLPGKPFYNVSYRIQDDTKNDILENAFVAEILFQTNDYHVALRTPNGVERVKSETVPDARDSWRHNGVEMVYGQPLWRNESELHYLDLSWEVSGGILLVHQNEAYVLGSTVATESSPSRDIIEYRRNSQKLDGTASAGLKLSLGIHGLEGSQYKSMGLNARGGTRHVGAYGDTTYLEFGVELGF